jgi:glutathione S-transferase
MRARMAILAARQTVRLREIELKHKPPQLLEASPKGTVPVLIVEDVTRGQHKVLDESLDIMRWALNIHDPLELLHADDSQLKVKCDALIATNDGQFKAWLDKYKYADRHPQQSLLFYRTQAEVFIAELELLLTEQFELHGQSYLLTNRASLADYAIFPFIRQFALVDEAWFDTAPYPRLQAWLSHWLLSELFVSAMYKYPPWLAKQEEFLLSWE